MFSLYGIVIYLYFIWTRSSPFDGRWKGRIHTTALCSERERKITTYVLREKDTTYVLKKGKTGVCALGARISSTVTPQWCESSFCPTVVCVPFSLLRSKSAAVYYLHLIRVHKQNEKRYIFRTFFSSSGCMKRVFKLLYQYCRLKLLHQIKN